MQKESRNNTHVGGTAVKGLSAIFLLALTGALWLYAASREPGRAAEGGGYLEELESDYDGDGLADRVYREFVPWTGASEEDASQSEARFRIDFGNGESLDLGAFGQNGIPSLLAADLTGDGKNEIALEVSYVSANPVKSDCAVYRRTENGYKKLPLPWSPFYLKEGGMVLGYDVYAEAPKRGEIRLYCPATGYLAARLEDETVPGAEAGFVAEEPVSGASGDLRLFVWEGKNYLAYSDQLRSGLLTLEKLDVLVSFQDAQAECVWMGTGLDGNGGGWYGPREIGILNGSVYPQNVDGEPERRAGGLELDADLDGRAEEISLTLEDAGKYTIRVGDSECEGYGENVQPGVTAVSFDGEHILLAVFMEGAGNDPKTVLYSYGNSILSEAGSFPGDILELEKTCYGAF